MRRPEPAIPVVALAVLVYGAMLAAGLAWLWLRGRTGQIALAATGTVGLPASAGIGIATGLAIAGAIALGGRQWRRLRKLEQRLHDLLGPLEEWQITVVALLSALAEELFFRLAMQDALGLWWTAVIFALLHSGPGGLWLWTAFAFVLGAGFGWMVEAGWGLLAVTLAHALVNWLGLRRMQR